MLIIKQPNNLYTVYNEDTRTFDATNILPDEFVARETEKAKRMIEEQTMNLTKAASNNENFFKDCTESYLHSVGFNGDVVDFSKSIEKGPIAVKVVMNNGLKEVWGRCPNCGESSWLRSEGGYSDFRYTCNCGQAISWNKITWLTETTDYVRCDGRMPGALLVVMEQTPDSSFNSESMIRISTIVRRIPDITIGEYVIESSKFDSSWDSDKYRRCDGRMMNSLAVVIDACPDTEFDSDIMIKISEVSIFIPDITIGEYVILSDLYYSDFNPDDEEVYVRCPEKMPYALKVVGNDQNPNSDEIKLNMIMRYIRDIKIGEYIITVDMYDKDWVGIDYVSCPTNTPCSIPVVDDCVSDYDETKMMRLTVARIYVPTINVGDHIIDNNYYDPKWNQYDTSRKYAMFYFDKLPENSWRIIKDETPMTEFNRDTMIRLSSARLLVPHAKVGYCIIPM